MDESDADLVEQAKRELGTSASSTPPKVEAGYVVRMPKAYPVYDEHYKANVDVLRRLDRRARPNVYPVGRNGMHRYNNQDHSMLTAMLSVENIFSAAPRRLDGERRSRVPRGARRRVEERRHRSRRAGAAARALDAAARATFAEQVRQRRNARPTRRLTPVSGPSDEGRGRSAEGRRADRLPRSEHRRVPPGRTFPASTASARSRC